LQGRRSRGSGKRRMGRIAMDGSGWWIGQAFLARLRQGENAAGPNRSICVNLQQVANFSHRPRFCRPSAMDRPRALG
jgi:hypothetical protein